MNGLYPLAEAMTWKPEQTFSEFPGYERNNRLSGSVDADVASIGSGTVRGTLTMGTSGAVRSGQTGYDTGTGFWIGSVNGTPKLSLGNSAGNKITWDGSTLTVTGSIAATSLSAATGSITTVSVGGALTLSTSGTFSSGKTSYGDNTNAGFWFEYNGGTPRVDIGSATSIAGGGSRLQWNGTTLAIGGNITATAGTIGGWTLASTTLTSAGGTIVLDSGNNRLKWGDDYAENNLIRMTVGTSETGKIQVVSATHTTYSGSTPTALFSQQSTYISSTTATYITKSSYSSTRFAYTEVQGSSVSGFVALNGQYDGSNSASISVNGTNGGSSINFAINGNTVGQFDASNRSLSLGGRFYPGPESGGSTQSSRYLFDDGNRFTVHGDGTNAVIRFDNATTTPGAGALSAYLIVRIGSVDMKIPFYAMS